MTLNIKDPAADRLARRLAALTGESLTEVVGKALSERLDREERRRGRASMDALMGIVRRYADRPVVDDRGADEILGYDQSGLPR
ncbi:MAG: type II toxin-antitoxin system VapB family antitoxin [Rhodospirillales bacterium]|nr:type II toxin-antitoxin system VapB family antitoxin [Rhodospirillales bacterium]